VPSTIEQGYVVFTGLTLSQGEARSLVNAEIRPPVRSGDLDQLSDGKTVVIIDGVLGPDSVLSLCEIRQALRRGVKVKGASSLGALRAHEARCDGMDGSGWVYQQYVGGRIDGTDEISVAYDPLSLRPLTIPLVNVRFCLHRLVSQSVVSASEAENAMSALKSLPTEDRNGRAVLQRLVHVFGRDRLRAAFRGGTPMYSDIKRSDACEMLQSMAVSSFGKATHDDPHGSPAQTDEPIIGAGHSSGDHGRLGNDFEGNNGL
jgi:hypothetical protein